MKKAPSSSEIRPRSSVVVKILVRQIVKNLWCVVGIRQNRWTNRTPLLHHVKVIARVCNLSFLPNVPRLHFCIFLSFAIMHLHLMHQYAFGVRKEKENNIKMWISACVSNVRSCAKQVSLANYVTVLNNEICTYLCLHQCIILHQYIQHLNEHQVFILCKYWCINI